jgi:hypothetical protein
LDDTRDHAGIDLLGCTFFVHIPNQAFAFSAYG